MKLVSVNLQCQSSKTFIVMRSAGSSYFSKRLMIEMDLKDGDHISFLKDADRPEDYYISKTQAGYIVKQYKSRGRTVFEFHARTLARDFGRIFGVSHKTIKIAVGVKEIINDKEYYPLITAALKQKK